MHIQKVQTEVYKIIKRTNFPAVTTLIFLKDSINIRGMGITIEGNVVEDFFNQWLQVSFIC